MFFLSVTKLREHWGETNAAVIGRKKELEDCLSDSSRWESQLKGIDEWFQSVESKVTHLNFSSHGNDLGDQKVRAHAHPSFLKTFPFGSLTWIHIPNVCWRRCGSLCVQLEMELHQLKQEVDAFHDFTHHLVGTYHQDDPSRLRYFHTLALMCPLQ